MTSSVGAPSVIRFGAFALDAAKGELRKAGVSLKIHPQPLQVLVLLVEHARQTVTREEIQRCLWGDNTFVDFERGINFCINQIRATLGDDAEKPKYVETIPRRGYRFIADVSTDTAATAPAVEARQRARYPAVLTLSGVVLAGFLAVGIWSVALRDRGEAIDSLAVLPFANASADPNTDYLSDGLTESLINNLAQLSNLRVVSRNSAFRYKGKDVDPKTVGRDLGVRAVLTGRIVQHGDDLSISSDLVDTQRDRELWGEHYSRKISDIASLQEEIATEISAKLRLRLTGEEKKRLKKGSAESSEAYQLYLKGRYFWNKRTPLDVQKATEYFQQAIEKDPTYALAYAGLADCHVVTLTWDEIPRAKAAATKALELDDTLAEAHASLAFALMRRYEWPAALKEFRRSFELNPNYPTAHQWYAQYLSAMGHLDEALIEAKQAERLDPLSPIIGWNVGQTLTWERQYDQAVEQFRRVFELDSSLIVAHVGMTEALNLQGDNEDALDEWARTAAMISPAEDKAQIKADIAEIRRAQRSSGSKGYWQAVLRIYLPRSDTDPYMLAIAYTALGDKRKAFEMLEKMHESQDYQILFLKVDPFFDSLHSDLRFADLLQRMGLPR